MSAPPARRHSQESASPILTSPRPPMATGGTSSRGALARRATAKEKTWAGSWPMRGSVTRTVPSRSSRRWKPRLKAAAMLAYFIADHAVAAGMQAWLARPVLAMVLGATGRLVPVVARATLVEKARSQPRDEPEAAEVLCAVPQREGDRIVAARVAACRSSTSSTRSCGRAS